MIPQNLGHIWIGPLDPPIAWMETWRNQHPSWKYTLYDNEYLLSRRFKTQELIVEYFRQGEYAGVADLMRYEILLEHGGFMAAADSVCLRPIDELLDSDMPFTCYEIDPNICVELGMPRKRGLMCPILGSPKGHPVLEQLVEELAKNTDPSNLPKPWKGTGNFRLRSFFKQNPALAAQLVIHPAHYFVPEHFRGWKYEGTDKPFCRQLWGTTLSAYPSSKKLTDKNTEMSKQEILARLERTLN